MDGSLVKAVINLDAIGKNVVNLKQKTASTVKFMAVVKADGYGHGAVRVAQKALEKGASWLGVARLHEAIELRTAGIIAPILVFGYVESAHIKRAIDLNLTLSVYDFKTASKISAAAQNLKKQATVHLKVDTGMGRMGMIIESPCDRSCDFPQIEEISKIKELSGIKLEGIYTHFAAADHKNKTYTLEQIRKFDCLLSCLEKKGVTFKLCHAANSAGIIEFPQSHYDMVRAGISLYGLYPSNEVDKTKVELFPAMTLTSMVTGVRSVPKGFKTSYGMTWQAPDATILASVPVGYGDGFSRQFSSNGCMVIKGQKAPIVGRVCMDQTMIDVGKIKDIAIGDEVVLFGSQGDAVLSADELADTIGTINYEIVTALTSRVERSYIAKNGDGRPESVDRTSKAEK